MTKRFQRETSELDAVHFRFGVFAKRELTVKINATLREIGFSSDNWKKCLPRTRVQTPIEVFRSAVTIFFNLSLASQKEESRQRFKQSSR